ncbi:hypothetical protein PFTANZ_02054 [Plasmodium falciparum Tanzania (2000708)]|uniref:Uncharacterized protein n=1 Tax=Plasmodium falciparum Tanzania (2000708) TaxID=1036725 RepID=A0A024WAI6_PLAFA|nr:hypothetical protein PFTANZ_02054 [Plasmodium falciparum Tanzania (2000708)]
MTLGPVVTGTSVIAIKYNLYISYH